MLIRSLRIVLTDTLPSVIHGWKATDLPFMMVKRKKYFFHPVKRQIFGDTSGKTSALILTVCLIVSGWQGEVKSGLWRGGKQPSDPFIFRTSAIWESVNLTAKQDWLSGGKLLKVTFFYKFLLR